MPKCTPTRPCCSGRSVSMLAEEQARLAALDAEYTAPKAEPGPGAMPHPGRVQLAAGALHRRVARMTVPTVVMQALDDTRLPPMARLCMWHLTRYLDVSSTARSRWLRSPTENTLQRT